MFFTTNIKLLRKRRGRTQDEIALALNMKRSTLSGYENGIAQPSLEVLIAFSRFYKIAIDTLVTVNLEKLSQFQFSELERGNDVFIKGSNLRVLATTISKENEENIELVPEKAKAGYATGFADPEFIKELPTFNLPFLSKSKKYRTFQLKGDSMLPIPDGSWVTGEFVQDWNTLLTGYGYIIFTLDEGIVFKIVENLIEKDGKLTLYSLNPIYEPFDVSLGEIKEIWKFVNYISSELPEPSVSSSELVKTVAGLKRDVAQMKLRMMNKS
jgi:transcriptional regulator with XRE-family HTH domain